LRFGARYLRAVSVCVWDDEGELVAADAKGPLGEVGCKFDSALGVKADLSWLI